tara:strand:+ start:347 stop:454 length:108 start_codon:yes stop_codon:yes gene_type:complete
MGIEGAQYTWTRLDLPEGLEAVEKLEAILQEFEDE